MAAVLTVTAETRTNRTVSIAATGFAASGTLVVSIDELGVSASFGLSVGGDLASPSPLTFQPTRPGKYTVRASDGTTAKTATVQVYATT